VDGVVIPASAVRDGKVFVVDSGKAVQRLVRLGRNSTSGVEILSGLAVGDVVIVNPPANLQSGLAVSAQEESQAP
jgi:HlyD family secretion protein